jgi:hypothetical protein
MLALLCALGGLLAVWAGIRGATLLMRGIRDADDPASSLRVIRGIRGLVIAIGTLCLVAGALFAQTWLLVFGGAFLAEELYETGVVVLVLRSAARQHARASGMGGQGHPSR